MNTLDLTKVLKPYAQENLWVALTSDYKKVAGSGKTPKEALEEAGRKGTKNPTLIQAASDYSGLVPTI